MSGLDLDDAQEARNNARKLAHLASIQWEAFVEYFPLDSEVRIELMKIWYGSLMHGSATASMADGLGEFLHGMFIVQPEEDEDDE